MQYTSLKGQSIEVLFGDYWFKFHTPKTNWVLAFALVFMCLGIQISKILIQVSKPFIMTLSWYAGFGTANSQGGLINNRNVYPFNSYRI